MSIYSRIIKALSPDEIRHPTTTNFFGSGTPRTKVNYANEVGDMTHSSVVMAVVQWIQRAMPEARFAVMSGDKEVKNHPLTGLMDRPNSAYSSADLLSAVVLDYLTLGNGYWLPARNNTGRPVELWYAPASTMTPKFPRDGSEFISHWEYNPGGSATQRLELEDVVHFRHSIDKQNLRLGISPLHSALREIFSDTEASNFSSSMLRNMGAPGMVLSPKHEQQMTPDEAMNVKKWINEAFRGDRRGEPLVMGMPTEVKEYGFSPSNMALSAVRNVSEERVCALLGIPASVVGFGTGLEQTKVGATMSEQQKQAWTNGVIPILNVFAGAISDTLLTAQEQARGLACVFNTSDIAAMQADEKLKTERWNTMLQGGWATRAEARASAGLETTPADNVYLTSFSILEIPQGQASPVEIAAPVDAKARRNKAEDDNGLAFVRQMRRMLPAQSANMQSKLVTFFAALGASAAKAAKAELKGRKELTEEDKTIARKIMAAMDIPEHTRAFEQVYEAQYLEVAEDTNKAMGLATDLPDPVARSVVASGGTRAGLVDLTKQTKDALYSAVADGRVNGLGADALARSIRSKITAGPWSSVEIRARVIARTETIFAGNKATVALGVEAGADMFVIRDGLLGEDVASDRPEGAPAMAYNIDTGGVEPMPENHALRGGGNFVVTAAEAADMTAGEHPMGLLNFSPYFEDI